MKRCFARWLYFISAIIIFSGLFSCKLSRFVYYNYPNITDYKVFPSRPLVNDSIPFHFNIAVNGKAPKTLTYKDKEITFGDYLAENKTVAFLIIKNDSILYEKYFNGYEQSSVVASFSMAKSITSILVGCALDEGLIKSIDEPVANYVPELKKNGLEGLTIRHLLQMTSGIAFKENYTSPFGDDATYYYGRNLKKALFKMKPRVAPGKEFSYSSGDSQLLGLVLERALKGKTLAAYLQEKLWKPLGMEYDGSWSLDKKNGLEKTFCCINARARDFAKIGRLYLNKGNWNGRQVVSKEWVAQSTVADTTAGGDPSYKFQWWLSAPAGAFQAEGILGQYIYVYPAKDLVIVRLGEDYGAADWDSIFATLAEKY